MSTDLPASPAPTRAHNPRADCAMDADGRITFTFPLPHAADPHLLLRLRPKKGAPETVTHTLGLERVPGAADRWCAVLGAEPALAEGRWDVYALAGPDAPRLRLLPGVRDLRLAATAALPTPALPLAVRLPYVTKARYLALRAWLRPAHAEAGDIRVTDGGMTVRGRLLGGPLGEGATALLRRRGKGGPVLETPLRDEGAGAFSFTAVYDFPPPAEADPPYWDVFVRPAAGAPRVRLARLLDDVADKKPVFIYPATDTGATRVRPYYTLDNDLAVEVTASA